MILEPIFAAICSFHKKILYFTFFFVKNDDRNRTLVDLFLNVHEALRNFSLHKGPKLRSYYV